MIVEQRDYHVYTGKLNEVVRMYADEGIALQQEHLGESAGFAPGEDAIAARRSCKIRSPGIKP